MTTKMTIHFDCEKTRLAFFDDIGELILWNDAQRDDDSQHHYEDTTSYAFPDLDSFDSSQPDACWNYLNYSRACKVINPICKLWIGRQK